MPVTELTFQVLEACFEESEFREKIGRYLEDNSAMSDREALSIIRMAFNDPDMLEAAIELYKVDYRDLFMASGHGHTIDAHEKWAKSILDTPPRVKVKLVELSVIPNENGVVKCPKCGYRFNILKNSSAWDGFRHKRCGQRLEIKYE